MRQYMSPAPLPHHESVIAKSSPQQRLSPFTDGSSVWCCAKAFIEEIFHISYKNGGTYLDIEILFPLPLFIVGEVVEVMRVWYGCQVRGLPSLWAFKR